METKWRELKNKGDVDLFMWGVLLPYQDLIWHSGAMVLEMSFVIFANNLVVSSIIYALNLNHMEVQNQTHLSSCKAYNGPM